MQRSKGRAFILACIASILCGGAPAQTSKTFSDWVATCDNTRACAAIGMGASDALAGGYLVVSRDAGPGSAARVTLGAQFDWDGAKQRPVEISFDEPGFENVFPKSVDMAKSIEEDRVALEDSALPAFVAALRKAKKLTINRKDRPASADGELEVSLAGAVAALLWIDERQGRARNESALVAKGPTPGAAVPAPRHAPVVARARSKAQKLNGKPTISILSSWKKACEEWETAVPNAHQGYELAPGLALWEMPCSRGAYNFSSMYFLAPRGGAAKPLLFETLKDGKLVAEEAELVNSDFDPKALTISFFNKGRGIGDCGSRGAHVWDGKAFRLVELFTMNACRGMLADVWPRVWKAQVK